MQNQPLEIGPILLGKKDTPLDWSNWNDRAMRVLHYIPNPPLTAEELFAMGFVAAARNDPSTYPMELKNETTK